MPSACSSRTTTSARRSTASSARVLRFADLPALREQGRVFAAANPGALDERGRLDRRGRPLHVHLHVGHDRPAEGLHDHATATTTRWCRPVDELEDNRDRADDMMLLYLPLAHNFGRLMHLSAPYVGYTLALLRRRPRGPRSCSTRPADAASRACRASTRRSTPRCSARLRRDDRAEAPARRLGARGRPRARLTGSGAGPSRWGSRCRHRLADRLVLAKVQARLGGRLRFVDLRRRAARARDRRVLPRDAGSRSSRATA